MCFQFSRFFCSRTKCKKHLQIMRRIEWRWVSVVEQGVRECAQGCFFLRDFAFNESSVD